MSSDLNKHLVSVLVDEDRKHILRKVYKTKKGTRIKESDHHTILAEFNCKVAPNKNTHKIEVYNLKNKECQAKFKSFTTSTKMFSSVFECSDSVDDITNRLVKKINGAIAKNFSKRRISFKTNDSQEDSLFDKIRDLKDKTDDESKAMFKEATDAIAERATSNFNKLKEELSKIKKKLKEA